MRQAWPTVPLSDVARQRKEFVQIDDLNTYKRPRVQLHARGVVVRDEVPGAFIKTKAQQVCRAGELLVAEIDAKVGGFGIVPESLDGAIVSSHYFLFAIDDTQLDRRFLNHYIRTPGFRDQVEAQGSTNYAAIRPADVLGYKIPLPPLPEQRRIVARIEEFAEQIEKAHILRKESSARADSLMATVEMALWPDSELPEAVPLSDVTLFLARGRQAEQGPSEHRLIKSQHVQQGRCLPTALRLAPHAAAKVSPEACARDGDILIACSAAGCLGRVARYHGDVQVASTDTHVAIARADPSRVEPDYLYAYLLGAQGQFQLRSRERGDWSREKVGFRLTELNLSDLRQVPVPLPDRKRQLEIVKEHSALSSAVGELKHLQSTTAVELDALLPAILDRAFKGEL